MVVKPFLAEDNPGDVLLFRMAMAGCPVAVELRVEDDGEAAWRALSGDDYQTDLIVLDVNLPKLTGVELLNRLRSNGHARVPDFSLVLRPILQTLVMHWPLERTTTS